MNKLIKNFYLSNHFSIYQRAQQLSRHFIKITTAKGIRPIQLQLLKLLSGIKKFLRNLVKINNKNSTFVTLTTGLE